MKELSLHPKAVYSRVARAKNPEKNNAYQRGWRMRNPDWELQRQIKNNRKDSLKRAQARVDRKISHAKFLAHNKPDKLEGEILRHHAKGRSIADIVVWMNIPASVVTAAIEKSKGAVKWPNPSP